MTRYCLFLSFCLLAIVFPVSLTATNFYVSPSGSDSQPGTSPSQAWQSISKVNSEMYGFNPGDSILFERGGDYYGFLQIYVSGSASQPIVFAAYGSGPKPHLKASELLSSWTHLGGEVYKAQCPNCPSRVNSLFIDGVAQRIGRYPNIDAPNKGYLNIDSGSGKWHITDNNLNFPDQYWQGGEAVVRNLRWIVDRVKINNFQNNTLSFSNPTTADIKTNFGYFFQNHPATFDRYGEWSYNDGTKEIYIYHPGVSPGNHQVEVSRLSSNIITSSLSHVHFHHLRLTGSQDAAIKGISSDDMVIQNIEIYGAGKNGITINDCHDLDFEDNVIIGSNNTAVIITASFDGIFINNTIQNSGMVAGMGENGNGTHSAIWLIGNNNLIANNHIDSIGYVGIRFEGNNNIIRRNCITNGCQILDDGSGIYTWNNGVSPTTGNKIEENIILHMEGAGEGTDEPHKKVAEGIYIDDRSRLVEIYGNTIGWVSDNGILIHNSKDVLIRQNTIYKADVNQVFLLNDLIAGPNYPVINCTVDSNLLISTSAEAPSLFSSSAQNDLDNFGSFNYNQHCNPFDSLMIKRATNPLYPTAGPILSQRYPLSEYVSITGQERQSAATDIDYPSFWIKDTLGSEEITNTSFDTGISDWSCWGNFNNNCNAQWAQNELDNGALEIGFLSTNGNSYVEAYHLVGQIDSGMAYAMTFSGKGFLDGRRVEITLQQASSPYGYVVPPVSFPIESHRKDYQYYFIPEVTESNTRLVFRIKEDVYKFWLDNVSIHPVRLDTLGDEFMELLYNPGTTPKTFELDKGYIDPMGFPYCGSVTIPPFKSTVLLDPMNIPTQDIYNGPTVKNNYNDILGCEWVHVLEPNSNEPLVSMHPNDKNYGQILVNTYLHHGSIRQVNSAFVLDRNWVLHATQLSQVPPGMFSLRFFITRGELNQFLAANPQIQDIHGLGIVRYSSSNFPSLNDNFADNTHGAIDFFGPEEIKVFPYRNGFYLEVAVDNLGEFWISDQPLITNTAFPVEFLDFDATQINRKEVEVTWTTTFEENTSHFVIQRSLNQNFWEEVGKVDAAGNSQSVVGYTHLDVLNAPYQGKLYYRLKEVDLSGDFSYSNVVELKFNHYTSASMEATPNPVKDILHLRYFTDENQTADLRVVNSLGQIVLEKVLDGAKTQTEFSVKGWIPGVYYLHLSNPHEVVVEKVVVQ